MPTVKDLYFAQDGQTVVELIRPYVLGTSEIIVSLNGTPSVLGTDYTEVDETHIEFNYQLSSFDVVIVDQHLSSTSDVIAKAGEVETLFVNQKYTLNFKHGEQLFQSVFHTRMDPLYSSVETVRNDLGDITSEILDERILYLIFQNSILSQNIASEENLALLESEEKTPYVFKQFVRYRTEMDILIAIYMLITGRQGSVTKTLGELKVDRRYVWGTTIVDPIIADLKDKLKEWEKALRGSAAMVSPVVSAVRGGSSNPYPLTTPRRGSGGGTTTGG